MKFNAIKLNFSMIEIVDQKLNFVLKKEEELELWKCIYSTLALFAVMAVRVYRLQVLYIRLNVSLNYSKNE